MFDENIDVAAIMRQIKAEVAGKEADDPFRKLYTDETGRITDFILNVKKESERYQDIGSCLPACKRFPAWIAYLLRTAARVVRKLASFIIRDQMIVNHNTNAMIQALVERDDSILKSAQEQTKELQDRAVALAYKVQELERELTAVSGKGEEVFDAGAYVRFENKFRGNGQEVREKLEYYSNRYVEQADGPGRRAIDIGCGRGEWLQLMRAKGYQATGVDKNAAMVQVCIESGMDAVCDDALAYLSRLETGSVSVFSAFQVIEHMPKTEVLQLAKEARRVLVQHGLLLLETPNIQNIEVGASSFYLDPTHRNPMHPQLLLFMAEMAGFQGAEIVYWNKDAVDRWIAGLAEQDETQAMDSAVVRTILETLKDKIYLPPDYALVARK